MTKSIQIILAVLIVIVLSLGLAWFIQGLAKPSTDLNHLQGADFDRQYLADMRQHHQGAIEMAQLAHTKASSQSIKDLASQIIIEQTAHNQQLEQWQHDWHGTSDNPDSHMSHQMDTMARALDSLIGADFDQAFLSQMIAHHQMAVEMSQLAVAKAEHQQLKDFATQDVKGQANEIDLMKQLQKTMSE